MQDKTKNSGANLRKSTDQLASSSIASPVIISEISVAFKPKAVRLKPVANHSSETAFKCDESVQAASSKLDNESTEISKESSKNIILYRPIAQVVSSSTLLKKLENYEEHNQTLLDEQFQTQQLNQIAVHQSLSNTNKFHSSPNSANESKKTKVKSQHTTSNGGQNSSDGYNWRKYGQKQVKGSEYPRAYYRCIHPCCPVKKMVERSKDGEINEIVYRGDHNHPKSQKIKKTWASTLREQESVIEGNGRNLRDDLLVNDSPLEIFFENKTDNCDVEGFLDGNNSYVSLSFGADCKGGNDSALCTMDGLEKKSQRRQYDDNTKGCLMVSQKTSIHEVAASIDYNYKNDDGYHWRKYGQKVVKGNSYPRNYYRCTNQNCKARKYVERTTDGPGLFLTTYEGYHKH